MASNSGRRSGSSGRSSGRKRVVIGADETTRVRYEKDAPQVESERRKQPRQPRQEPPRARTKAAPRAKSAPRPTGAGRIMAAEKRDERERRRRAIGRRRFLLVALAVAAVAALIWGLVALWRAPLFPVQQVIVTGNRHLTTDAIIGRAEIPSGTTLPRLPRARIEQRLSLDPWIAAVEVDRDYPSTVRIAVTERTPAALVDMGGTNLWVVSKDGYWLGPRAAEDTAALTAIRDVPSLVPTSGAAVSSPEVENAVAVLAGVDPALMSRVRAVSAPSVDKTALILDDDVQVFVGSSDEIGKKSQLALEILKTQKGLVYINVRVTSRPTWRGLDTPD